MIFLGAILLISLKIQYLFSPENNNPNFKWINQLDAAINL
jgi:hypothetical protein